MSNEESLSTKAYMYWIGRKKSDMTNFNPHITSSKKEAEMLGDRIDELVRREDVEALIKDKMNEALSGSTDIRYIEKKVEELLDEVQEDE